MEVRLDSVQCSSSIVSDDENDPDWYTHCCSFVEDDVNCNLRVLFVDFGPRDSSSVTLSLFRNTRNRRSVTLGMVLLSETTCKEVKNEIINLFPYEN